MIENEEDECENGCKKRIETPTNEEIEAIKNNDNENVE